MDTALFCLNPEYERMHREARAALSCMSDLPQKVREFTLGEHEFSVLRSLEWLLNGQGDSFRSYALAESRCHDLKVIDLQTLLQYQKNITDNDCVLRWALLLHDIARRPGMSGPHPDNSARVASRVLCAIEELADSDKALIVWLIQHHDVLGNIYSGERAPLFLLEANRGTDAALVEHRMRLLQVVTLCDLRGSSGGIYLTDQKANYWLGLSRKEQIGERQRDLLPWRLQRWSGDLVGGSDPNAERALRDALGITSAVVANPVVSAFGGRISYIVYGYYLFVALNTKQLATLMEIVSNAVQCLEGEEVTLIFDRVYRPPAKDAKLEGEEAEKEVLLHYTKQLDEKALRVGVDLQLRSSHHETGVTKGTCLYCF